MLLNFILFINYPDKTKTPNNNISFPIGKFLGVHLSKGDILSNNLLPESTKAAKETEQLTKKINYLTLAIVMFTILQMYMFLKPDVQILSSKIIG